MRCGPAEAMKPTEAGVAENITREQLDHLLSDWCAGRMTATTVHDWAVNRYAVSDFTPEDAIVNEVLARLDMLDANLTTADDVPALRRLLDTLINAGFELRRVEEFAPTRARIEQSPELAEELARPMMLLVSRKHRTSPELLRPTRVPEHSTVAAR